MNNTENPSSQPEAPLPTLAGAMQLGRRPTGKIAQLPRKVRQQLNTLLTDGLTFGEVITALGEPGKHLNVDNVRRWHSGPYQRWLKEQVWLEQLTAKLDFAAEVLRDPDSPKIREASLAIAVKQMYDLLASFDPALFAEKLGEDPAAYSRLLNALAKLAEIGLRYDQGRQAASRAARETQKSRKPAGLTEELLRQYESEFNLLRRPPVAADTRAPEQPKSESKRE
jgi:hypothetical protein